MPLHLVNHHTAAISHAAMIFLAFGATGAASHAEAVADSRVRSESPWILAAIADGNERSPTFRRLVAAINATNGMVYIQEGRCRRSVRACLHLSVGIAGAYRFLRILVASRKAPGCELVSSIGHELQHALEVLSEPTIRSERDMYAFFDRKAPAGWRDAFETDEALELGIQVEKEVCD